MITETEIRNLYQEVRREFAYPPTRLQLTRQSNADGAPFYIEGMTIFMNVSLIHDAIQCRSLLRHEFGHAHIAPITLSNSYRFYKWVMDSYGLDSRTASLMLNVAYDMIVDFTLKRDYRDDIAHRVRLAYAYGRHSSALTKISWMSLLYGFYEILSGMRCVSDRSLSKIRVQLSKIFRICRRRVTLDRQVQAIFKVLMELYGEQKNQGSSDDRARNDLHQAHEDLHSNPCMEATKDRLQGQLREKLLDLAAEIDPADFKEKNRLIDFAAAMGVVLEPIDFYRARARKNVRFAVSRGNTPGPRLPAGHVVWSPEEPATDLDPVQGICHSGINIPGVTTLKPLFLPGNVLPGSGTQPAVIIVMDTSGSIKKEDGLVTLFSLINATERQGFDAGVVLFSDDAYYAQKPCKDYRRTEEEVYRRYQSGGTKIGGALSATDRIGSNCLVLVVSDFCVNEGIDFVNETLSRMAVKSMVVPIILAMNTFNRVSSHLNPVMVRSLDELNSVIIDRVTGFAPGNGAAVS